MKKRRYGDDLVFSTTFRVSNELRTQLRMLAKRRGQLQSEVLREAIKMLANQQQQEKMT